MVRGFEFFGDAALFYQPGEDEVMSRPKANQKETLQLDLESLRTFFPDHTPKDMESAIIRILTEWQKKEQSKVQSRSSWDRDGR